MMLNKKEEFKYETIEKVCNEELSKKEAANILNMSIRNINRLIKKYHEVGINGFSHHNKGKVPANKIINDDFINSISDDYIKDFQDFNFTHYLEETEFKNKPSYTTVYRAFTKNDICSPEANKQTKRNYLKRIEESIKDNSATDEQIILYNNLIEIEEEKHFRRSSNNFGFFEEIQMDGTFDIWYGDKASCLQLSIDKATKYVPSGQFDDEETSKTYYCLLKDIVINIGIPKLIKTDRRNSFDSKSKSSILLKKIDTQFAMMCNDLGIELECSSNPLSKPNIERLNKTFKGRLKNELKRANIQTKEEANKYLKEIFIPKYNQKFSRKIDSNKSKLRENNYTELELDIIFSERYIRTVDNASSIKYNMKYYIPYNLETGELIHIRRGELIYIFVSLKSNFYCRYNEVNYGLMEVDKVPKVKEKNTKTIEEINASKAHKPAANHPWRNGK